MNAEMVEIPIGDISVIVLVMIINWRILPHRSAYGLYPQEEMRTIYKLEGNAPFRLEMSSLILQT